MGDGFESARQSAVDELTRDTVKSFYTGLLHERDGEKFVQYRISTDSEDERMVRRAGSAHLGLLIRVLAEQTGMSVQDVARIGEERAKEIDSLPVRRTVEEK